MLKTTCGIYLFNIHTKKILICHASHSKSTEWTIPKGLKEDGEDYFTAAVRELKEETNVDIKQINVLEVIALPAVKYEKQNKKLESFFVLTDSNFDNFLFRCNTFVNNVFPEIDQWLWINPDQINHLLHESQRKNSEQINGIIKQILKK
jgi:ADP-ribose pyrophosphatase YjhB (NUDIX family)